MICLFDLDDSLTCSRFTTRTELLTNCCEPLSAEDGLVKSIYPPPQKFYITERSKVILLSWFHLFYVLESNVCIST